MSLYKKYRHDYVPTARDDGRTAFSEKHRLSANPHAPGTPEHREWARGWKYARHVKLTIAKKGTWRRQFWLRRVHPERMDAAEAEKWE